MGVPSYCTMRSPKCYAHMHEFLTFKTRLVPPCPPHPIHVICAIQPDTPTE